MQGDERHKQTVDIAGVQLAIVTSVPFFLVTQLKRQLIELHGLKANVVVLTAMGPELVQIEWDQRLKYHVVDIRRKPAPWHDLVALMRMIWLFRKNRFHIVHSTTPKAGFLTAVAAWLARVPVRLHTFTGQPWVTMSGPLRWVSRASDRVIGRLNTRCYADSPSQRAFLVEQGIVPAAQIGVIGSGSLAGVDTVRFDRERFRPEERERLRRELGIAPQAGVLLFIGRVNRDKGIVELLGAVRALRTAGHAVELLLVGPLEIGRSAEDRGLAQQIRQADGVHAIGYSDQPEKYLAITDILCLPSYREGFGTVVIEAAAMAVPTVGTRITGLSDAVVDRETGLLVPPRDAGAVEKALRLLLENPALRAQFGRAARERCLREFDARIVNWRLAEEYVRLLKQAGIAPSHV